MKKLLQIPLLLVALFLTSIPISAHDFEVDGIYYNYLDKTAKTVCVTYGTYTGAVTIPSTVNYSGTTYSVTQISDNAFKDCYGLTSVTIPNSVTSIGNKAFYKCSGLTSVTIPNSVTEMSDHAFRYCTGLTSVTIGNSVTEIGTSAFNGCTGLTSVTIGNSVTSINEAAFYLCSGLTSVTIPNSVTSIGNKAFYKCSGLTEVTFPNLVTEIGNDAFYGCTGLTTVNFNAENCTLMGASYSPVFSGCTNLKTVNIGNSVKTIPGCAFYGCSGLTSVTIPNSVTSIGPSAFRYCTGLTEVTIGNSVTSIGSSAFDGCTGLTEVTIGNSVTSIGKYAFDGCTGLTEVNISDLSAWCKIEFGSYNENPLYYAKKLKLNGSEIKDLVIPNDITEIKTYAFYNCDGLISVTIPNSVTAIGNAAISSCSNLTSVSIPNSVTSIGDDAFSGCTGLTSVTIPNSVTSIGSSAFRYCTGLTSVTIGNSVDTIGSSAFTSCYSLKAIVSLNPSPPSCYSSGSSLSNYSIATLYVPKDSYAKYYIDDEWGKFTNIKKIETLATSIALNKTSITLDENATDNIFATIMPSDASVSHLAWTSDNPQVATVDYNGKVTAIKAGEATITAKTIDGSEVSVSCKVIVKGVETIITLSQTEAQLSVNDIMTLSYSAVPTTTTVEWSTSDANVAPIKVNSNGSVTVAGIANGVATITAKATDGSGASASCVVTVGVSGIEGVETNDNAVEVARYDVHGRLLSAPAKGINIVKYSDGTVKKIIHN